MISKEVRLKGEMNGITYFDKGLDLEASDITLEIPRSGIPFGIMMFPWSMPKGLSGPRDPSSWIRITP